MSIKFIDAGSGYWGDDDPFRGRVIVPRHISGATVANASAFRAAELMKARRRDVDLFRPPGIIFDSRLLTAFDEVEGIPRIDPDRCLVAPIGTATILTLDDCYGREFCDCDVEAFLPNPFAPVELDIAIEGWHRAQWRKGDPGRFYSDVLRVVYHHVAADDSTTGKLRAPRDTIAPILDFWRVTFPAASPQNRPSLPSRSIGEIGKIERWIGSYLVAADCGYCDE